jgi:hypothetical protein
MPGISVRFFPFQMSFIVVVSRFASLYKKRPKKTRFLSGTFAKHQLYGNEVC